MEFFIISLIVGVAANVISHYIVLWIDKVWRDNK